MNIRNQLLKSLNEKSFAAHEWSLYLDTHSGDVYAHNAFKKAMTEYKAAKENYVREFGPLCCEDGERRQWVADPWPWDYEGCDC